MQVCRHVGSSPPADGSSALLPATVSGRTAWARVDSPTGCELLLHAHQPFPHTHCVAQRESWYHATLPSSIDGRSYRVHQASSTNREDMSSFVAQSSMGFKKKTKNYGTLASIVFACTNRLLLIFQLHHNWAEGQSKADNEEKDRKWGLLTDDCSRNRRGRLRSAVCAASYSRHLLLSITADTLPLAASVTPAPRRQPQRQYLSCTWERRRGSHLRGSLLIIRGRIRFDNNHTYLFKAKSILLNIRLLNVKE